MARIDLREDPPRLEDVPVLHRDEHLVAVDKPSGLLVHPSDLAPDRITCLSLVRERVGRPVHPVHRIDRQTSGVLLFARSPRIASALGRAFREREVEKTYRAVCRGWTDEETVLDRPLAQEKGKDPVPSLTRLRRLDTTELPHPVGPYETARYSFVELRPRTGRRHQIRRHLKHDAHPVVGDTTHGDSDHNRFFRRRFDLHRMLLFATEICLPHPATGEGLVIRARVAEDVQPALREMGWDP